MNKKEQIEHENQPQPNTSRQSSQHQLHSPHSQHRFNGIAIPADWKLAENHAKSRRTALETHIIGDDDDELGQNKKVSKDVCKCCGYQIERIEIGIYCEMITLQFLGSGYPLFYNYIKYCIILLSWLFLVESAPILYTFYNGNNCVLSDFQVAMQLKKMEKQHIIDQLPPCASNFPNRLSMANVLNNPGYLQWQIYLTIICQIGIISIMIYFRYIQIKIDNEIDEYLVTPADYTVVVKNIPKGLKIDYEKEIKKRFNVQGVFGKKINVEKVVLVYDLKTIEEIEEKIKEVIKEKKAAIIKNNYDFSHASLNKIEEEIEHLEHQLDQEKRKIIKNPQDFFSGIAFVSFSTEDMKQRTIHNNHISQYQRIKNYFNQGQSPKLNDDIIYWNDRHLYVEPAPEPNDVDWEFINVETKDRIIARIKCNIQQFLVMFACFSITWTISFGQSKFTDMAFERMIDNKPGGSLTYLLAQCISILISIGLVVFNKFFLGDIVHHIVDKEKWSTKTKLNISFAQKLTLSLFFNTAMITLAVEILTFGNYYGTGGMVSTETWVFFFNAFIPPLAWIINPWVLKKNKLREEELAKAAKNQSVLTQQEANDLMEGPPYVNGKRYADIMKTMWFTFLYSPMIPTGVLWSIIGLMIYYWADKYNIIKRYTVKESLSKDLTIAMIDFLEYIVLLHAFGDFFFKLKLYGKTETVDILIFCCATMYNLLMIIDWPCLLPNSQDEEDEYQDVCGDFDTNYDRENPIFKKAALLKWIEERMLGQIDDIALAHGLQHAFGQKFEQELENRSNNQLNVSHNNLIVNSQHSRQSSVRYSQSNNSK